MDLRKFLPALAASAVIFPSLSSAGAEKNALDVCARAFASSIASPGTPAPTYRLNFRGAQEQSALVSYYNRVYTFDLHANDAKTGLQVARATCAVDTNGKIVSLLATPVDASSAAFAARL